MGLSAIAERTGASLLVAGFLAGMVIVRLREPDRLSLQLTGLANGFFVPLFFVVLGARLVFHRPSRSGDAWQEFDVIDKANHRHINR